MKNSPGKGIMTTTIEFPEIIDEKEDEWIRKTKEGIKARRLELFPPKTRYRNIPRPIDFDLINSEIQKYQARHRGSQKQVVIGTKITREEAMSIRSSTKTHRELAEEYRISRSSIWRIKNGEMWK